MGSPLPKIASRGRWQPKPKAAAPPPPQLVDLKDDNAPVRAGRVRPYLFGAAAILPLAAGVWLWMGVPDSPHDPAPRVLTSPSPQTGVPPITSASVVPGSEAGTLVVHVGEPTQGALPEGVGVQWYVNEQPLLGQTASVLPAGMAKRGDKVLAELTVQAGTLDAKVIRTPSIELGNVPPVILAFALEPSAARAGEPLRIVTKVTDVDQDDVTLTYRWSKNGLLIQDGPVATLSADLFARGDRVMVEVIPSDRYHEGTSVHSEEVTIGNGHPRITSLPTFAAEGNRLQLTVVATDPDHDPVQYRLASAPHGMDIDKTSGKLVWVPSPGVQGAQRVRVEAVDDRDGVAVQEFDVTVPAGFAP